MPASEELPATLEPGDGGDVPNIPPDPKETLSVSDPKETLSVLDPKRPGNRGGGGRFRQITFLASI